jgi:hypothetical protein
MPYRIARLSGDPERVIAGASFLRDAKVIGGPSPRGCRRGARGSKKRMEAWPSPFEGRLKMDENGAIESLFRRRPILGAEEGYRMFGARGISTPFFFGGRRRAKHKAFLPASLSWRAGFSFFCRESTHNASVVHPERDLRIGRQA